MRLGLLQCDDVNASLIKQHDNYPAMFAKLFASECRFKLDITWSVYRVIEGEFPASIDECDAYITTGSQFSVNDDLAWIHEFERFIRVLFRSGKKLIGICFGHQMIAKALGGSVEVSAKGWGIGVMDHQLCFDIEKTLSSQFERCLTRSVEQVNSRFSLLVSHKEQVVSLPKAPYVVKVIARSEFCPYYMFQINEHFLGLQGHPEFTKSYSLGLMTLRKKQFSRARFEQGISSLDKPIDQQLVITWLVAFLLSD